MNNEIRVVVKNVGEPPRVQIIENELEVIQGIVGGYIETFPLTDDIYIILNEEGKLMGLEPNLVVPCHNNQTEVIVGNVILVSIEESDFAGLSIEHLIQLTNMGFDLENWDII